MDCRVVRVVVTERRDGAGEEKVLSRSPSVRGTVVLVPAPDLLPVSEVIVSAVVARVGARDFTGLGLSCEVLL